MTDARPASKTPQPTFLADYQPPAFLVPHIALIFRLDPARTVVVARLTLERNPAAPQEAPLVLDGEDLELQEIRLDGTGLTPADYSLTDKTLTIPKVPDRFTLETETVIAPAENTKLMGLYQSNGMFCTQCEAEGFRRITFFPDRPDVLSTYDVRIEADKAAYPVLLANGNPGAAGDFGNGRHFAEWADPFPKPCYLFALVGGDLAMKEDRFTTMSGRDVTLRIFVQPQNLHKCDFALDALKRSMKWDEEVFGREYDLDLFMIVAVDHFNFGAMENKGLNIFNSSCVLASPETATDAEYERIEAIVAHEYFHNWSGNRITCRDWFQLCLKEGFTVFRDQEFSADARDRAVTRIRDVRRLRAAQFPEDAGPLAHPVRPESFITIDNFYTATVYEKGAELVRMLRELLGPDDFRAATDLYFEENDGTAATVEEFIAAMEKASGRDLEQFRLWYDEAGTPDIHATEDWDNGTWRLTLTQSQKPTPGQQEKHPKHIPCRLQLIGSDGINSEPQILELTKAEGTLEIADLDQRPVASLFQGFSAPVKVHRKLSVDDRLALLAHDGDAFNRWDQNWSLAMDLLATRAGQGDMPDDAMVRYGDALAGLMEDDSLSPAFRAELLAFPQAPDMARSLDVIDPPAFAGAVAGFQKDLALRLEDGLLHLYRSLESSEPYQPVAAAAGRRALKNAALNLALAGGIAGADDLAETQAAAAHNMTDEAAAVAALARHDRPHAAAALEAFYNKWQEDPLVIDKWLAWQALTPGNAALDKVEALTGHEAFDFKHPNKVRALIGTFAAANLDGFHRADGAAYRFFFETIRKLDRLNPPVAARLTGLMENWRKLTEPARSLLQDELQRLAGEDGLSENTFEMATRLCAD